MVSGTNNLRGALREEFGNFIQQSQISEIKQKYRSINSLKDSEKIQAVKDTSLNPFMFDNPYDGLANSMSRWAQEAPAYAGKSGTEKIQIASKYYDEALAPLYIKLGAAPLSRDNWLRNAWKSGLTYDASQAYRNPILKGALHGEDSAIAEVMNATRTLTNVAGLPIVAFEDSIKNGDFTGLTGWHNLFMNMHNRVKEDGLITGVAKAIEETGERNPTGGSKWMHDISSQQSFWRDVSPARTFSESATSMVVENGMLLPLFGGISKATEAGIGLVSSGTEGVPMIKNLTQALSVSKVGQMAAKALTYGTEGLVFGNLTTDVEDKKDAWKTALQFAAMGTLFSGLGKGASKLVDMLPEGAEKDAMSAAEKEAELGAQGKQSATMDEYIDRYRTHMASVMSVSGRAGAASIIEEALSHVAMEEKAPMETMDRLKYHQDMSDDDPIKWRTVFSSMTVIKKFLDKEGWKLAEFKSDDSRWGDLKGFLNTQLDHAASEIDMRVPEIQQMKGKELLEPYMKTPEGQKEWQKELAKQTEAFRSHPGGAEKAPKVAMAEMLKRRMKAVQKAAEEKNVTGPKNVIKSQPIETASRKVDSRYEYDKSGKVTGYQMGISFNWNVAADKAATAKGGKNSSKFWQEYVDSLVGKTDDDVSAAHAFADDLRTYFNPLKDYGLTFEKANTQGGDWTNFLAFMYSYRKNLPKPVANKLEDILMSSPKMSQLLGRKTTTEGIEEFGQAIQNHVDIFTRSDWYKKYGQRNVYRSSQPGIHGQNSLSPWQRDQQLIASSHRNDLGRAKEFYPGQTGAMKEARMRYQTTLKALQAQEMKAYLEGKPHVVAKIMKKVRAEIAAGGN